MRIGRPRRSQEEIEFNKKIGTHLRQIRMLNNIPAREVAVRLAVDTSTVLQYERGKIGISLFFYKKFKTLYGSLK